MNIMNIESEIELMRTEGKTGFMGVFVSGDIRRYFTVTVEPPVTGEKIRQLFKHTGEMIALDFDSGVWK